MTTAQIEDGALRLGGRLITFPLPVQEVVAYDRFVVILLAPTRTNHRNVYAIAEDGTQLWQIAKPHVDDWAPGPFLGINKASEDIVGAGHSSGVAYELEARTGRVLNFWLQK